MQSGESTAVPVSFSNSSAEVCASWAAGAGAACLATGASSISVGSRSISSEAEPVSWIGS